MCGSRWLLRSLLETAPPHGLLLCADIWFGNYRHLAVTLLRYQSFSFSGNQLSLNSSTLDYLQGRVKRAELSFEFIGVYRWLFRAYHLYHIENIKSTMNVGQTKTELYSLLIFS